MDAVFLVFAAVTGVMIFLAVQQSKIKRQIEEDRRKRGDDALGGYTGVDALPPGLPPDATPGPHSPHPHDGGGHHGGGFDAGGHHGGSDGGGGDGGGGGHH